MTGLSKEQIAARRNAIGMSQWAAILGKDSFQGPGNVAQDKLYGVGSFKGNKYSRFGTKCESVVAEFYEECYLPPNLRLLHGVEAADELLKRNPQIEVAAEGKDGSISFRHKEVWWYVCTPDRIVSDFSRLVEIKWISKDSFEKNWSTHELGSPRIPAGYHIQVLGQQRFFGGMEADLAVGFGGNSMRVFRINYRPEVAERCFQDVDTFVNRMAAISNGTAEWNPEWRIKPEIKLFDRHPLPTSLEEAEKMITTI